MAKPRNTNSDGVSGMPVRKMKRQTVRRTISPRLNRSTRLTVISASFSLFFPLFSLVPWLHLTMRPITSKSCFQGEQPDLFELLDLWSVDRLRNQRIE